MKGFQKYSLACLILSLLLFLSGGAVCSAQEKDLGGWGITDPYNQFYNSQDVDRIKAIVLDVKEITPLPGMSAGVGLVVEDTDDKDITYLVHVCPVWYKTLKSVNIKKGDKIDLRGSLVEIDGEEVIMAAKIKIKEKTLKVRLTSNGQPFWTLSPEELKKELMDN